MRVILVWPDKKLSGNNNVESMDHFWIECTIAEAEGIILPKLSEESLGRYHEILREPNAPPPEMQYTISKRFFLISRDGLVIEPCPWYFPFAGQWNAYCPFRCMRQRTLLDVDELQAVSVEFIDYEEWDKENIRILSEGFD